VLALRVDHGRARHLDLREVDEPRPAPSEALVELRAVSLNRGEIRRLPGWPDGFVPGWDVAGVVAEAAADGSGPRAGSRVAGLLGSGAWAQRAAVPTAQLAAIPAELTFAAAATLPVAGLTALRALALGGLLLDRRVLVTGAAGGVGRLALQLARRAGARVTAVAGTPERGEGLRELGADEVVVGFDAEGPEHDLILESAGGASLVAAIRRVARGGTVVTFGNSSDEPVTFDASEFYGRAAGARIYAFMLFVEIERTGTGTRDLETLAGLAGAGRLDPQIALEASWRQPEEAMAALRDRRLDGKAVLHVD
jgi:NADPH:quinone reductase